MFAFFGYPAKAEAVEEKAIGERMLMPLQTYIRSKQLKDKDGKPAAEEDTLKECKTALEVGKYRLALLLQEKIHRRLAEQPLNLKELQRDICVAFKINVYLEHPKGSVVSEGSIICEKPNEDPSLSEELITSLFTDRDGIKVLLEKSQVEGLRSVSEFEMVRLFKLFHVNFIKEDLPDKLPCYLKTGSKGYIARYSTLHTIIADLYTLCQQLILMPKVEKQLS